MKNTILKSYTKKILRSEAFVSVIIVFVLALGIIGTSYALYMDVDTDTDYQLVEVGDLAISFENPDGVINLEKMVPMDDDVALKSSDNIFQFYLYNKGNYTANYDIKLEILETNQVETQYINYQFCKDNSKNCSDIKTLSDGNLIYTDELSPKKESDQTNPSAYYFLRIWINNKYEITEGKIIGLKVTVDAKNASGNLDNKNTLAGAILNNPNIKINNDIPDFSVVETGEKGLYKTQDDHGVSYYFRGAQSYNYINFAGMCWRIVRIEGDGSVKLILEDRNEQCNDKEGQDLNNNGTYFTGNWSGGEEDYYVFGYDDSSGNYRLNFLNYEGGLADSFKTFQTTKLTSTDLQKLKVDEWCYDDKITSTDTYTECVDYEEDGVCDEDPITYEYEYYGAYTRISTNKKPSLNCTGTKLTKFRDGTDMYVGTLTADEMSFAGAYGGDYNFYLLNTYSKNNYLAWWSLSPSWFSVDGGIDLPFALGVSGDLVDYDDVRSYYYSRPAVSLKSDVLATTNPDTETHGQPGSITNPYVIN